MKKFAKPVLPINIRPRYSRVFWAKKRGQKSGYTAPFKYCCRLTIANLLAAFVRNSVIFPGFLLHYLSQEVLSLFLLHLIPNSCCFLFAELCWIYFSFPDSECCIPPHMAFHFSPHPLVYILHRNVMDSTTTCRYKFTPSKVTEIPTLSSWFILSILRTFPLPQFVSLWVGCCHYPAHAHSAHLHPIITYTEIIYIIQCRYTVIILTNRVVIIFTNWVVIIPTNSVIILRPNWVIIILTNRIKVILPNRVTIILPNRVIFIPPNRIIILSNGVIIILPNRVIVILPYRVTIILPNSNIYPS